jgi:1,2-diacylglycerol 3-beta-galactosyltransferase
MDSTQVLYKNDAFVFKFEYKQYRARVTHIARGRSLDVSFGDTQRERSGETVTAKERLSRPMFKNTFRSFRTVRYEMNTIRQLVSKQLAFLGLATHRNLESDDTNLSESSPSSPNKDFTVESSNRVLCLMSHTGGGHKASAQALKDGFECIYGTSYDVNIVDLWSSHSPWPLCNMPKSYFFLVKNPWLWRLNFRCSEPKIVHETLFRGYAAIVSKQFSRVFMDYNPHLIVSVHPLMQHVPLMSLERLRGTVAKPIPFATVVTDLTRCHPTWFHKSVLKCFVATKIVVSQALSLGLRASQIVCHGLPIRPSFSIPAGSRGYLREKLGLQKDARTVMLIGGGEGMGKITEIAEALSRRLSERHQLVIICGNNRSLVEKLSAKKWPFSVHIKGFVHNMSEYMSCCDCVITKAGPGTIAEALICGIPIILNGCIPCQEEGNIPFVLDNEVGTYSEDPVMIANTVSEWFDTNDGTLEEMSTRAKLLGRPEATFNIVRDLADLALE